MRVEARGLVKTFGPVRALDGLDLDVPYGRRVALVGPNGSGKSTLNRVLLGLLSYEGEVLLDGVSAREDRLDVARRIAYVPQSAPGLGAPVRDVLRALLRIRDLVAEDVDELAAELGLSLAEVADRPLRALSGGMKQKLAIAVALASRASLLVLDEPTGSLDAATRERFFSLFESRARGATVLLCSHRLEEVRQLVDHVLVLEEGRLVYDGSVESLLAAQTTGLVEVCAEGEDAASWLGSHGFRPGRGAWWLRTVSQAEKPALLGALTRALEESLRDVVVRDLEALELSRLRPASNAGGAGGDDGA